MVQSKVTFTQEGSDVRVTIGEGERGEIFLTDSKGRPTGVIDHEHVLKLYAWLGGILKQ